MKLGYSPYRHQSEAFKRLCGTRGVGTLIATGTGSGKTECFLYPLLDHCLSHRGELGIKAIVVYPMNALATDQAKRFAREIASRPELSGLRVGLFIGGLQASEGERVMTPTSPITCKEAMLQDPPDVLLTNYKELDYLLVREKDYRLWRFNTPGTLRYVVVDELHTFDGAQGADLACLLRRVYSRLGVDPTTIDRVGTSATLGSGAESAERLLQFARDVFGGEFDQDAVIGEDLADPDEFLKENAIGEDRAGSDEDARAGKTCDLDEGRADELDPNRYASQEEYLQAQALAWLGSEYRFERGNDWEERVRLGKALTRLHVFRKLLEASNGTTLDVEGLTKALGNDVDVRRKSDDGQAPIVPLRTRSLAYRERVFESLFALVSYARREKGAAKHYPPFLRVRVQLWLRETARLGASLPALDAANFDETAKNAPNAASASQAAEAIVDDSPKLRFLADVKEDEETRYLPLIHCRSCGRMAHLSFELHKSERLSCSVDEIYQRFFNNDPDVRYVYVPDDKEEEEDRRLFSDRLCPKCLTVSNSTEGENCPKCGSLMRRVQIKRPNAGEKPKPGSREWHKCPYCDADEIAIVGSRAASLAAAALAQLFGSKYNDDKKLLAFSDSVQDASHRAGFFVGRSFRTTLRAALQQYVLSLPALPTLRRVYDGFADFWYDRFYTFESQEVAELKKQAGGADAALKKNALLYDVDFRAKTRFVVQFLTPDLQNKRYDRLRRVLAQEDVGDDDFLALAREDAEKSYDAATKRVRYEILAEYARVSQIGRTLEKSRCSAAALAPEKLEAWKKELVVKLREDLGLRNEELPIQVGRFLASFVRELRLSGAVMLEEFDALLDGGNAFGIYKKISYMPYFGRERAPRFVQLGNDSKEFDALAIGKLPRRYRNCLYSALGKRGAENASDVFKLALDAGSNAGVLRKGGTKSIYALDPNALIVDVNVDRYVCSKTRRVFYAAACERRYWDGAESRSDVNERGEEYYELDSDAPRGVYAALYPVADVCRIVAKEHTGLLERQKREELENDFIAGTKRNVAAVNALSCTPTLEMGVNIGDLSCVVLCGAPPSRASYVQRIGRGGRRDGNSFNLIVATNRARDLYFFNKPSEAFEGPVDPPGVFLNAPSVLERQLIAYSFDRWIADAMIADPRRLEGKLPKSAELVHAKIGGVLANFKKKDENAFPFNFFKYVEQNRQQVFDDFTALFDSMKEETKEALRAFYFDLAAEGFLARIYTKLKETGQLVEHYKSDRVNARNRAKTLEKLPQDESVKTQLESLRQEGESLRLAAKNIVEKTTYEYLTDEGLLPNYAFPEEGAVLRSSLWTRFKDQQEENGKSSQAPEPISEEYERSARAAIVELAPGNDFFVDGRKLTVNRIDTAAGFDVEQWRFCADCGYVRTPNSAEEETNRCPKCGSTTWREGDRVRKVLRLKRVVAEQEEKETRAFDDKDDRSAKFFTRKMLIEYGGSGQTRPNAAVRLQSVENPFGFEYWGKATFRDVNFGLTGNASSNGGSTMRIAGEDMPNVGFYVCPKCGKVVSSSSKEKEFEHSYSCQYYKKESSKDVVDYLYLFREFKSESLRLSIPFDTKTSPSFVAAVQMALHEYFHGNVQHLNVEVQKASLGSGNDTLDFLTIYDAIPGGTGYLKEFAANPNELFEGFKLALARLEACECGRNDDEDEEEDVEKDGCYRCILEFRRGKDASQVSRVKAIAALKKLIKDWTQSGQRLETIDSLGALDYSGVTESQLETDFLKSFESFPYTCNNRPELMQTQIAPALSFGKNVYSLRLGPEEKKKNYEISCQVEYSNTQGVGFYSRADFTFEPTREKTGASPVVVYTDGYEYHADPTVGYAALAKDARQRSAIVRSKTKRRYCWSLSYDDVQYALEKPSKSYWTPSVKEPTCLACDARDRQRVTMSAYESLIDYLLCPDEQERKELARNVVLALNEKEGRFLRFVKTDFAAEFWDETMRSVSFDEAIQTLENAKNHDPRKEDARTLSLCVVKRLGERAAWIAFAPFAILGKNAAPELADQIRVAVLFNDAEEGYSNEKKEEYKRSWNSWLNAFNLLQFLPGTWLATVKSLREDADNKYDEVKFPVPYWNEFEPRPQPESPFGPNAKEWEEALEEVSDAEDVLTRAFKEGKEPPELFFDLEGPNGIVGQLKLAWIDEKLFWTSKQESDEQESDEQDSDEQDSDEQESDEQETDVQKTIAKAIELGWTFYGADEAR